MSWFSFIIIKEYYYCLLLLLYYHKSFTEFYSSRWTMKKELRYLIFGTLFILLLYGCYVLYGESIENFRNISNIRIDINLSQDAEINEATNRKKYGNILLGIIVDKKSGIEEFTSKIVRQYHNIPSEDIAIFFSGDEIDENVLKDLYGPNVQMIDLGETAEKMKNIFQTFSKSEYEILFLISGETIFSKEWKSYIERSIAKTDGFISLYHPSFMHNYTYDCANITDDVCLGDSTENYEVAFNKKIVEKLTEKNNDIFKKFNWTRILKENGIKNFYSPRSLTMRIGQKNQSEKNNYCGENEVPYRFSRCDFPDWIKDGIEFYFDRCTNPYERYSQHHSIEKIKKEKRFWVRPVISYSFYGNNYRYTRTALQNAARVFSIYPGWKIWIYTDYSVPYDVMNKMCEFDIRFIDMKGTNFTTKMSWRFLVASEPVKMFAVRDIDSWLLARGKAAVDEWISSGKIFHTMRDHKNHAQHPMNGGMWGGRYGAIPNMEQLLHERTMTNQYMQDMKFLREVIWPIANKSVWAHDSHSLHKFSDDHPFPTKLENPRDFVGRVAIY